MIRRLLRCVREYKKESLLTPLFVAVEVLMECMIPLYTANLIDDGVKLGNMDAVLKNGGILVLMAIVSLIFGTMAGRTSAMASTGFARNLRHDMFYRVQDFSFTNIDSFSTAGIVTRLTTDVSNLQNAYMMVLRVSSRSPIMLIFSFCMAFGINRRLSLVFLAVVPFLFGGLLLIMMNAHPIFKRVFKLYDKLNIVIQENLRGIRVVKSFVREDYETKKFNDVSQQVYDEFTHAERLIAFNMPLMQLAIYTCMILIAWLGAGIIVSTGEAELSTGQLTSMITYAMQILMSLMMLSMGFVMVIISRASAERAYELLSAESTIKNPENPVFSVSDGSISFKDVCFGYGADSSRLCLKNVSLDIASGETVGIIGGTGSSKSTLVQLIPRLYDVTGGRVLVGGVDVRDYDIETLRNAVAMVLQKNELFSGSIKENLRWGNESATDDELREACILAAADGFISEMPDGYDTHIEQGGTNVSGGQKQRLCIARALLKKPKILILDDSTSAVDTATDAQIRKAMREYIPSTTKIIIAQRISSVQDADKIIVLDGGAVAAVGTHDELLDSCDIYREVYISQQKGGESDGE